MSKAVVVAAVVAELLQLELVDSEATVLAREEALQSFVIFGEGDHLFQMIDYTKGEANWELGELGDDFTNTDGQVPPKPGEEVDRDVALQQ